MGMLDDARREHEERDRELLAYSEKIAAFHRYEQAAVADFMDAMVELRISTRVHDLVTWKMEDLRNWRGAPTGTCRWQLVPTGKAMAGWLLGNPRLELRGTDGEELDKKTTPRFADPAHIAVRTNDVIVTSKGEVCALGLSGFNWRNRVFNPANDIPPRQFLPPWEFWTVKVVEQDEVTRLSDMLKACVSRMLAQS
ncbi:hypothetical protein [Nocardia jiangsuensis]|uniref:Uncharacterized protein n=1 Tax=Nocardia jiangsuensis TaxID=1691563 RepID=A0ABV8DXH2_9NOCA